MFSKRQGWTSRIIQTWVCKNGGFVGRRSLMCLTRRQWENAKYTSIIFDDSIAHHSKWHSLHSIMVEYERNVGSYISSFWFCLGTYRVPPSTNACHQHTLRWLGHQTTSLSCSSDSGPARLKSTGKVTWTKRTDACLSPAYRKELTSALLSLPRIASKCCFTNSESTPISFQESLSDTGSP